MLARSRPRSIAAALALSAASCSSEGTLLVRHDGAAGAPTVSPGPDGLYVPPSDARWLAKLDDAVDVQQNAELFYLDAEFQDPGDLDALHAEGRHYLCYLSAGSLESYREDAAEFPAAAIGKPLASYPRERWLDVRDPSVRELMARRVTRLADLGCDGVPPAALAAHAADTGFDLSLADVLDYSRWLVDRLHAAGLSAGLTGPTELTEALVSRFDFGLAIACADDSGCSEYDPLSRAGKPVLHVELGQSQDAQRLCNVSESLGFDALISDPDFTGQCVQCRDLP